MARILPSLLFSIVSQIGVNNRRNEVEPRPKSEKIIAGRAVLLAIDMQRKGFLAPAVDLT
jgi:hypothetical protein